MSTISIPQIYHPYNLWEDYSEGMWDALPHALELQLLEKAIEFTGNAELYGKWMITAADSWKHACEHNLTDLNINRRAWIGHAACCLAIKCPEHITRSAWHQLTKKQQDEANAKADIAIQYWEEKYGRCLACPNEGSIRLF